MGGSLPAVWDDRGEQAIPRSVERGGYGFDERGRGNGGQVAKRRDALQVNGGGLSVGTQQGRPQVLVQQLEGVVELLRDALELLLCALQDALGLLLAIRFMSGCVRVRVMKGGEEDVCECV